jgi:hypothetical protein
MRRRRAKYVTLVTQMRCPSCGTDNAPDSRFCGGCGARFGASSQRVAPTEKISDDASFPQRQLASSAGSAVPVTAPGVMAPRAISATPFMPQGASPAPRPLAGGSAAPARPAAAQPIAPAPRPPGATPRSQLAPAGPAGTPAPPGARPSPRQQAMVVDDPSLSLPIAARRPWALIALVLVIDLGLAVSGAWMLSQGLGDRTGRAAPPRSGERAQASPRGPS